MAAERPGATTQRCILAYWHEPRFSSGYHGTSLTTGTQLWTDLLAAGADVILNGHDHDYERFALQDGAGHATPSGIREFVVGTGGREFEPLNHLGQPNSEVVNGDSYGVLRLTLRDDGYDWRFVPVAGSSFTDSGSASCH